MSKITLLDCTLRDGGYINKWHFGKDVISAVCRKLSEAKVDIIEVGFLTNIPHTEEDSLYAGCAEIDAVTKETNKTKSKIAAMIAIGEMELDPSDLPPMRNCALDIVRITFHSDVEETEKAFRYAKCLMDKGYQVCMQPVGTTAYTDLELLELVAKINQLEPYAFYLVDTLGILQNNELLHFVDMIDNNLKVGIRLGYHSHNNLQMAYSNAQCISRIHSSREFIVDCSVYGMGRGAGNLCTELIAHYLNGDGIGSYGLTQLYEILDDYIYPIFTRTGWGYNAHYYIAAAHRCHPNYASFLMNKQTLTMNEVDLILRNIPAQNRYIYDKKLIECLYYNFQNHNIDDKEICAELEKHIAGRDVLLLAPGKSLCSHKEEIKKFIEERDPVIFSINGFFGDYQSNYVFVSNLKRLYMLNTESLTVPVILTSNLPKIVHGGLYVDYSALCNRNHDEIDNSGVMLIRLMERIGVKRVHIAGYDGFSKDSESNYFDEKMINSVEASNVKRKTTSIARQINEIMCCMEIVSLTPSRYFQNDHEKIPAYSV